MANRQRVDAMEDWFGFAELTDVPVTNTPEKLSEDIQKNAVAENIFDRESVEKEGLNCVQNAKLKRDVNEIVVPIISEKLGIKKYKVLARQKVDDDDVDVSKTKEKKIMLQNAQSTDKKTEETDKTAVPHVRTKGDKTHIRDEAESKGEAKLKKKSAKPLKRLNISALPNKTSVASKALRTNGANIKIVKRQKHSQNKQIDVLKKECEFLDKLDENVEKDMLLTNKLKKTKREIKVVAVAETCDISQNGPLCKTDSNVEQLTHKKSMIAATKSKESDTCTNIQRDITHDQLCNSVASPISTCTVKLKRDPSIDSLHKLATAAVQAKTDKSILPSSTETDLTDEESLMQCDDTLSVSSETSSKEGFGRQKSVESKTKTIDMIFNADIEVRKSGRLKSAKCASRYRGDYGIRADAYTKIACKLTSSTQNEDVQVPKQTDEPVCEETEMDVDTDSGGFAQKKNVSDNKEIKEQTMAVTKTESSISNQTCDVTVKKQLCSHSKIRSKEKKKVCARDRNSLDLKRERTSSKVSQKRPESACQKAKPKPKSVVGHVHREESAFKKQLEKIDFVVENKVSVCDKDCNKSDQCESCAQFQANGIEKLTLLNSKTVGGKHIESICQSLEQMESDFIQPELQNCDSHGTVPSCKKNIASDCSCGKDLDRSTIGLDNQKSLPNIPNSCCNNRDDIVVHPCDTETDLKTTIEESITCMINTFKPFTLPVSSHQSGYIHSVGKSVNKKENQIIDKMASKCALKKTDQEQKDASKESSPEMTSKCVDHIAVLENLRAKLMESAGVDVQEVNEKPKQFESKLISSKLKASKIESKSDCADSSGIPEANCSRSGRSTPRSVTPRSVNENCDILEEVAETLNSMHKAKRKAVQSRSKPKPKRQRFEQKKFLLRSMLKRTADEEYEKINTNEKKQKLDMTRSGNKNNSCSSKYGSDIVDHSTESGTSVQNPADCSCSKPASNNVNRQERKTKSNKSSAKSNIGRFKKAASVEKDEEDEKQLDINDDDDDSKKVSVKTKMIKCQACGHSFKSKELLRKHYPCRIRQTRTWSQNKLRPNRAFRRTENPGKADSKFVCRLPKSKAGNKARPKLLSPRKTKFRRVKGKRRRKLYQLIHELKVKRKPIDWPHLNVLWENMSFKEQNLYKLGLICVDCPSNGIEFYSECELKLFEEHRKKVVDEINQSVVNSTAELSSVEDESESAESPETVLEDKDSHKKDLSSTDENVSNFSKSLDRKDMKAQKGGNTSEVLKNILEKIPTPFQTVSTSSHSSVVSPTIDSAEKSSPVKESCVEKIASVADVVITGQSVKRSSLNDALGSNVVNSFDLSDSSVNLGKLEEPVRQTCYLRKEIIDNQVEKSQENNSLDIALSDIPSNSNNDHLEHIDLETFAALEITESQLCENGVQTEKQSMERRENYNKNIGGDLLCQSNHEENPEEKKNVSDENFVATDEQSEQTCLQSSSFTVNETDTGDELKICDEVKPAVDDNEGSEGGVVVHRKTVSTLNNDNVVETNFVDAVTQELSQFTTDPCIMANLQGVTELDEVLEANADLTCKNLTVSNENNKETSDVTYTAKVPVDSCLLKDKNMNVNHIDASAGQASTKCTPVLEHDDVDEINQSLELEDTTSKISVEKVEIQPKGEGYYIHQDGTESFVDTPVIEDDINVINEPPELEHTIRENSDEKVEVQPKGEGYIPQDAAEESVDTPVIEDDTDEINGNLELEHSTRENSDKKVEVQHKGEGYIHQDAAEECVDTPVIENDINESLELEHTSSEHSDEKVEVQPKGDGYIHHDATEECVDTPMIEDDAYEIMNEQEHALIENPDKRVEVQRKDEGYISQNAAEECVDTPVIENDINESLELEHTSSEHSDEKVEVQPKGERYITQDAAEEWFDTPVIEDDINESLELKHTSSENNEKVEVQPKCERYKTQDASEESVDTPVIEDNINEINESLELEHTTSDKSDENIKMQHKGEEYIQLDETSVGDMQNNMGALTIEHVGEKDAHHGFAPQISSTSTEDDDEYDYNMDMSQEWFGWKSIGNSLALRKAARSTENPPRCIPELEKESVSNEHVEKTVGHVENTDGHDEKTDECVEKTDGQVEKTDGHVEKTDGVRPFSDVLEDIKGIFDDVACMAEADLENDTNFVNETDNYAPCDISTALKYAAESVNEEYVSNIRTELNEGDTINSYYTADEMYDIEANDFSSDDSFVDEEESHCSQEFPEKEKVIEKVNEDTASTENDLLTILKKNFSDIVDIMNIEKDECEHSEDKQSIEHGVISSTSTEKENSCSSDIPLTSADEISAKEDSIDIVEDILSDQVVTVDLDSCAVSENDIETISAEHTGDVELKTDAVDENVYSVPATDLLESENFRQVEELSHPIESSTVVTDTSPAEEVHHISVILGHKEMFDEDKALNSMNVEHDMFISDLSLFKEELDEHVIKDSHATELTKESANNESCVWLESSCNRAFPADKMDESEKLESKTIDSDFSQVQLAVESYSLCDQKTNQKYSGGERTDNLGENNILDSCVVSGKEVLRPIAQKEHETSFDLKCSTDLNWDKHVIGECGDSTMKIQQQATESKSDYSVAENLNFDCVQQTSCLIESVGEIKTVPTLLQERQPSDIEQVDEDLFSCHEDAHTPMTDSDSCMEAKRTPDAKDVTDSFVEHDHNQDKLTGKNDHELDLIVHKESPLHDGKESSAGNEKSECVIKYEVNGILISENLITGDKTVIRKSNDGIASESEEVETHGSMDSLSESENEHINSSPPRNKGQYDVGPSDYTKVEPDHCSGDNTKIPTIQEVFLQDKDNEDQGSFTNTDIHDSIDDCSLGESDQNLKSKESDPEKVCLIADMSDSDSSILEPLHESLDVCSSPKSLSAQTDCESQAQSEIDEDFPKSVANKEEIENVRFCDDSCIDNNTSLNNFAGSDIVESDCSNVSDDFKHCAPYDAINKSFCLTNDSSLTPCASPDIPPVLEKVNESVETQDSTLSSEDSMPCSEEGPPVLELVTETFENEEKQENLDSDYQKSKGERHFLDILGAMENSPSIDQANSEPNTSPKTTDLIQTRRASVNESETYNYDAANEAIGRHFSDVVIDSAVAQQKASKLQLQHLIDKSENEEVTLSELREILKSKSNCEKTFSKQSLLKMRSGIADLLSRMDAPLKKDPAWLKRDSLFTCQRRKRKTKGRITNTKRDDAEQEMFYKNESDLSDTDMSEGESSYSEKDSGDETGTSSVLSEDTTEGSITSNILQMLNSLEDKGSVASNMSNLLGILAENLGFLGKGSTPEDLSSDSDSEYSYGGEDMQHKSYEKGMTSTFGMKNDMMFEDWTTGEGPPPLDEIPTAGDDELEHSEPEEQYVESDNENLLQMNVVDQMLEKEEFEENRTLEKNTESEVMNIHKFEEFDIDERMVEDKNVEGSGEMYGTVDNSSDNLDAHEQLLEPDKMCKLENIIVLRDTSSDTEICLENVNEMKKNDGLSQDDEHMCNEIKDIDDNSGVKGEEDLHGDEIEESVEVALTEKELGYACSSDGEIAEKLDVSTDLSRFKEQSPTCQYQIERKDFCVENKSAFSCSGTSKAKANTIFKSITELNSIETDDEDSNAEFPYNAAMISQNLTALKVSVKSDACSDVGSDLLSNLSDSDDDASEADNHLKSTDKSGCNSDSGNQSQLSHDASCAAVLHTEIGNQENKVDFESAIPVCEMNVLSSPVESGRDAKADSMPTLITNARTPLPCDHSDLETNSSVSYSGDDVSNKKMQPLPYTDCFNNNDIIEGTISVDFKMKNDELGECPPVLEAQGQQKEDANDLDSFNTMSSAYESPRHDHLHEHMEAAMPNLSSSIDSSVEPGVLVADLELNHLDSIECDVDSSEEMLDSEISIALNSHEKPNEFDFSEKFGCHQVSDIATSEKDESESVLTDNEQDNDSNADTEVLDIKEMEEMTRQLTGTTNILEPGETDVDETVCTEDTIPELGKPDTEAESIVGSDSAMKVPVLDNLQNIVQDGTPEVSVHCLKVQQNENNHSTTEPPLIECSLEIGTDFNQTHNYIEEKQTDLSEARMVSKDNELHEGQNDLHISESTGTKVDDSFEMLPDLFSTPKTCDWHDGDKIELTDISENNSQNVCNLDAIENDTSTFILDQLKQTDDSDSDTEPLNCMEAQDLTNQINMITEMLESDNDSDVDEMANAPLDYPELSCEDVELVVETEGQCMTAVSQPLAIQESFQDALSEIESNCDSDIKNSDEEVDNSEISATVDAPQIGEWELGLSAIEMKLDLTKNDKMLAQRMTHIKELDSHVKISHVDDTVILSQVLDNATEENTDTKHLFEHSNEHLGESITVPSDLDHVAENTVCTEKVAEELESESESEIVSESDGLMQESDSGKPSEYDSSSNIPCSKSINQLEKNIQNLSEKIRLFRETFYSSAFNVSSTSLNKRETKAYHSDVIHEGYIADKELFAETIAEKVKRKKRESQITNRYGVYPCFDVAYLPISPKKEVSIFRSTMLESKIENRPRGKSLPLNPDADIENSLSFKRYNSVPKEMKISNCLETPKEQDYFHRFNLKPCKVCLQKMHENTIAKYTGKRKCQDESKDRPPIKLKIKLGQLFSPLSSSSDSCASTTSSDDGESMTSVFEDQHETLGCSTLNSTLEPEETLTANRPSLCTSKMFELKDCVVSIESCDLKAPEHKIKGFSTEINNQLNAKNADDILNDKCCMQENCPPYQERCNDVDINTSTSNAESNALSDTVKGDGKKNVIGKEHRESISTDHGTATRPCNDVMEMSSCPSKDVNRLSDNSAMLSSDDRCIPACKKVEIKSASNDQESVVVPANVSEVCDENANPELYDCDEEVCLPDVNEHHLKQSKDVLFEKDSEEDIQACAVGNTSSTETFQRTANEPLLAAVLSKSEDRTTNLFQSDDKQGKTEASQHETSSCKFEVCQERDHLSVGHVENDISPYQVDDTLTSLEINTDSEISENPEINTKECDLAEAVLSLEKEEFAIDCKNPIYQHIEHDRDIFYSAVEVIDSDETVEAVSNLDSVEIVEAVIIEQEDSPYFTEVTETIVESVTEESCEMNEEIVFEQADIFDSAITKCDTSSEVDRADMHATVNTVTCLSSNDKYIYGINEDSQTSQELMEECITETMENVFSPSSNNTDSRFVDTKSVNKASADDIVDSPNLSEQTNIPEEDNTDAVDIEVNTIARQVLECQFITSEQFNDAAVTECCDEPQFDHDGNSNTSITAPEHPNTNGAYSSKTFEVDKQLESGISNDLESVKLDKMEGVPTGTLLSVESNIEQEHAHQMETSCGGSESVHQCSKTTSEAYPDFTDICDLSNSSNSINKTDWMNTCAQTEVVHMDKLSGNQQEIETSLQTSGGLTNINNSVPSKAITESDMSISTDVISIDANHSKINTSSSNEELLNNVPCSCVNSNVACNCDTKTKDPRLCFVQTDPKLIYQKPDYGKCDVQTCVLEDQSKGGKNITTAKITGSCTQVCESSSELKKTESAILEVEQDNLDESHELCHADAISGTNPVVKQLTEYKTVESSHDAGTELIGADSNTKLKFQISTEHRTCESLDTADDNVKDAPSQSAIPEQSSMEGITDANRDDCDAKELEDLNKEIDIAIDLNLEQAESLTKTLGKIECDHLDSGEHIEKECHNVEHSDNQSLSFREIQTECFSKPPDVIGGVVQKNFEGNNEDDLLKQGKTESTCALDAASRSEHAEKDSDLDYEIYENEDSEESESDSSGSPTKTDSERKAEHELDDNTNRESAEASIQSVDIDAGLEHVESVNDDISFEVYKVLDDAEDERD